MGEGAQSRPASSLMLAPYLSSWTSKPRRFGAILCALRSGQVMSCMKPAGEGQVES
jgi:hypothetical protein